MIIDDDDFDIDFSRIEREAESKRTLFEIAAELAASPEWTTLLWHTFAYLAATFAVYAH